MQLDAIVGTRRLIDAGVLVSERDGRLRFRHALLRDTVYRLLAETQRATLHRGDFFGEVSILLGEPPSADVVALRALRCIVLAGPSVEGFMISNPRVSFRMLQSMARRLRNANRFRNQ